jgi:hypothetical protein
MLLLLLLLLLLLCFVLAALSDHLPPPSLPLLPDTSYQTTWQSSPADGMLQHHTHTTGRTAPQHSLA